MQIERPSIDDLIPGSGPVVCAMFIKEMVDVLDEVKSTYNSSHVG